MRSPFFAIALLLASCEPSDMALPQSRNETASPSDPVPSDTINDLQDAIIGGKHGAVTKLFGAHRWAQAGDNLGMFRSAGRSNGRAGNGALAAYGDVDDIPIGAVITGFRVWVDPTVANTVTAQLIASNGIAAATIIGTTPASNALGNVEKLEGAGITPYTVVTQFAISVLVSRTSGAAEDDGLGSYEVDYYVP